MQTCFYRRLLNETHIVSKYLLIKILLLTFLDIINKITRIRSTYIHILNIFLINFSFPIIVCHCGCIPGSHRAVPVPSPREGLRRVEGHPDLGACRVRCGRCCQCCHLWHCILHHVFKRFSHYECYSSTYTIFLYLTCLATILNNQRKHASHIRSKSRYS